MAKKRREWKVGCNTVSKPDNASRTRYNIEIGEEVFGVGIVKSRMKSVSHIGAHYKEGGEDEVVMMDDGKMVYMKIHDLN